MLADDTAIITYDNNINTLSVHADNILTHSVMWFTNKNHQLNPGKAQIILSSNTKNSNFNSVKLLGIHIASDLSWSTHANNTIQKLVCS